MNFDQHGIEFIDDWKNSAFWVLAALVYESDGLDQGSRHGPANVVSNLSSSAAVPHDLEEVLAFVIVKDVLDEIDDD